MTAPEALTPAALPARVPASTVRAVRIFHGFTREDFADVFEVTLRTVFRWERDGVDPMSLQLDPNAHPNAGPEWRRKYLIWLLDRYEQLRVTDNRKQQGKSA